MRSTVSKYIANVAAYVPRNSTRYTSAWSNYILQSYKSGDMYFKDSKKLFSVLFFSDGKDSNKQ